jgi:hypothetical protein
VNNPTYYLVHVNIAAARASLDDPLMKGFVDRIGEIDALAQSWPGFIAQPTPPDEGQIYPGNMLVNVSIWETVDTLRDFTYASRHAEALKMRAEWFVHSDLPNYLLYWALSGQMPTEVEIQRRFDYLHQHGATPFAFSFKHPFSVEEMLDYQFQG